MSEIACDAWISVSENMRAIERTLDSLHAIERSGSASLADRAFQGFARLPAHGSQTIAHWSIVLGLAARVADLGGRGEWSAATVARVREEAEGAYRTLARSFHPDHGGSTEAMVKLNRAIADARKELS